MQGDRLANPSSTNPGMAAGRRERASASAAVTASRRCSAHLKAPPLKLQLPLIHPGVPANASHSGHMFLVLFVPMQMTLSEEMKEWGSASGLLQEATRLPALLKPYMRVPLERVTLGVRNHPQPAITLFALPISLECLLLWQRYSRCDCMHVVCTPWLAPVL